MEEVCCLVLFESLLAFQLDVVPFCFILLFLALSLGARWSVVLGVALIWRHPWAARVGRLLSGRAPAAHFSAAVALDGGLLWCQSRLGAEPGPSPCPGRHPAPPWSLSGSPSVRPVGLGHPAGEPL